jgi:hypothetical protein
MNTTNNLLSFLGGCLIALCLGAAPVRAQAQPVEPTNREVDYAYNQFIRLSTAFPPELQINQIQLVFQHGAVSNARIFDLDITVDNATHFEYAPAELGSIPAYSPISYYYLLSLQNGDSLETETFSFAYLDNRFEWQTLDQDERFVIHWYAGDPGFAQSILNTAQNSIAVSDQILALPLPDRLHIFAYADSQTMREALNPTGTAEVAGHANPSFGVILASIQPGVEQTLEIERQIPHEINHIRLYRELGSGYERLPQWLREGLASLVELYPNPDYAAALTIAAEENNLIPLEELCRPFPIDSRRAFLAYAQSQSFVQFLYNEYGSVGLSQILTDYAEGASCTNGTTNATGLTLVELERAWRTERIQLSTPNAASTGSASPWVMLAAVILVWPMLFILIWRLRR